MWLIKVQTRCFLIVTPVIVSCNMFTHCECGGERVRVKESAVIYLPSNENYISISSNGMRRGLCVIARNVVDKASDGNRRKPNLDSEIIFDTFTSAMTISFTCSLSLFYSFHSQSNSRHKGRDKCYCLRYGYIAIYGAKLFSLSLLAGFFSSSCAEANFIEKQ